MSGPKSPLIHHIDIENYGSTQTCQDDGVIANEPLSFTARNAGMLFIIYSQFFFASMDISVKLLNGLEPPVHALQDGLSWGSPIRSLAPKGVRMMLFIRSVTGFFGLSGMYWSLQYLSVADATVLVFLTPLTTAVAGSVFLKESYSVKQAVAAVFSLLGVVLIGRPAFLFGSLNAVPQGLPDTVPAQRLAGVVACMVSVLGNTGAYTSIRAIGKRAHPMHVMSLFSLWSTIISSLGMVVFDIPVVYPTSWMWILLLFTVGVFGFAAQVRTVPVILHLLTGSSL
ncbi:drug/metabolite transporter superfamily [Suillus subalutaceus]|uniref:drug/metabolite transporter superfamily n=1 Tax=Suillus subalutaceus TaxID=48586 RepID=UPI001B86D2C7|nr:drug/metabolite transporter superfamily [Suillus subalutaceus]KAG1865009.1 drug/metabolite transporter superfamily [Suillus subalutaceus]